MRVPWHGTANKFELSANLSKNATKWPKKWPNMTQNGPKMTRTFSQFFFTEKAVPQTFLLLECMAFFSLFWSLSVPSVGPKQWPVASRCKRKFGFGSDGWSFPNATILVWDLAARRRQGIRASTIAQCAIVQLYNIQCSHISQCAMWLYDMNRTSPPPMPPYGSDLRAITYLAYMWCTQIQPWNDSMIPWNYLALQVCKLA